jgi:hypothetical protein
MRRTPAKVRATASLTPSVIIPVSMVCETPAVISEIVISWGE